MLRMKSFSLIVIAISAAVCLGVTSAAGAQMLVAGDAIPDAPSAVAAQADQHTPTVQTPQGPVEPATGLPKQTKRILGIIPNFRAVSADEHLPPQTVKEKFIGTTKQSFDYSAVIFAGVLAGVAQAEGNVPAFHQGAAGYGRYYWHNFVDQTDENYWVQFILPAALHQDSRYYTLGRGGFVKRAGYAFSRIFITRTDSGGKAFNVSEIAGAGTAAGISYLYYPASEKTWTKTGQRWFLNVGIDGGTYLFQEFWPNINAAVFHQKN
jgi:hypothetical protein